MIAVRWPLLRIVSSLGLGVVLTVGIGASAASAQELTNPPDGQQFQNQSAATQRDFMATFGQSCAQREWVWQHSLAIDPDSFSGDPASDGQAFGDQDDSVQLAFVAWFGPQAGAEWVAEHNAVVAHKVLLGNTAPVPCPPAVSSAPTELIGTRHLSDAVDAAQSGDLTAAASLFDGFKGVWTAAKPKVASQSPTQAQSVQTAVDQVNALLGASNAQAQVLPALQNLLKVVTDTNASAGH